MITNEQKLEMFKMRLDNCSYQEIGDTFGVSRQAAYETLNRALKCGKYQENPLCVFPSVNQYMAEHHLTFAKFARNAGVNYTTLRTAMSGKCNINLNSAMKISEAMGLPVEKVFSRSDKEVKNQ